MGVASVRMLRAARLSRAASQPVGTAASAPPATAAAIIPGVRPPSSSLTIAPPKPNAPMNPAAASSDTGPSTSGLAEVQHSRAEQGERQHARHRPRR